MYRCWSSRGWTIAAGWALAGGAACDIDSRAVDAPDETASAGSGGAGQASAGASGASAMSGAAGAGGTAGDGGTGGAGGAASGGSGGTAGSSDMAGAGGAMGSAGAGGAMGSAGAESGNPNCPGNLLANGGFESGSEPWVSFTTGGDPLIYDSTVPTYEGVEAHAGQYLGWLGGVPSEINRLSQAVAVPANVTRLALRYSLRVQIFEAHATVDFLRLRLVVAGQTQAIAEFSNADAGEEWVDYAPEPLALAASAEPLSATLEIESEIGAGPGTNFYVDDLALVPTCAP